MCYVCVPEAGGFLAVVTEFLASLAWLLWIALAPAAGFLALIATQAKRRLLGQNYGWPFDPITMRGDSRSMRVGSTRLLSARVRPAPIASRTVIGHSLTASDQKSIESDTRSIESLERVIESDRV